jgi:hypothetical protein
VTQHFLTRSTLSLPAEPPGAIVEPLSPNSMALQRPIALSKPLHLADIGGGGAVDGHDVGGTSISSAVSIQTHQSSSSVPPSTSKAVADDDSEMVYMGYDLARLSRTWQFIILSASVFLFYFLYSLCQVRHRNACVLQVQ